MNVLKVIIGLVCVLAGAWFYYFPTYHHRYKMTVEIEADGEIHTGTGLVDVRYFWQEPLKGLAGGAGTSNSMRGRAPIIDLGKRGLILALLHPGALPNTDYQPRPESGITIALRAFYGDTWWVDPVSHMDRSQIVLKSIARETGARTLLPQNYPAFVWVQNRKIQDSAIPVTPSEMPLKIDASVRLRSVEIVMTKEDMDDEIFLVLPWLAAAQDFESKNMVLENPNAFRLSAYQLLGR
jgi:hypothetical protein